MKRFLVAVLLVAAMSLNVAGAEVAPPQDAHKPYLTVVGTPGEAKFEALKIAFERHEGLKTFAASTHYSVLADSTTMFSGRYSHEFGRLPAVRLQEADGDVIYEVSGRQIPTADQLCEELEAQGATSTCIRRKQQYQQQEQRQEYKGVDVAPPEKEKPEIKQPKSRKGTPLSTILWCVGGVAIGWCIGVGRYVYVEWQTR